MLSVYTTKTEELSGSGIDWEDFNEEKGHQKSVKE